MYFEYVLQSIKSKVFYKGLTDNFERRIRQHLAGECKTTKMMLPIQVIHVEICEDRQQARKLEKYFKSGFGREIIKEIAIREK